MKKIYLLLLLALLNVLSILETSAQVSAPTFTFRENGQGQLQLPNGAVIPLAGTLQTDSGPGGLVNALAFTTHPQEGAAFTAGDVFLSDSSGHVSDLVRFDPATTSGTTLTQLIFLYSNDSSGLLADTGLPASFFTNAVTIPENENDATVFIPSTGQPGFLPNAPAPITYRIFSVPDTGSPLLLFALGLSGLGLVRRKSIIS